MRKALNFITVLASQGFSNKIVLRVLNLLFAPPKNPPSVGLVLHFVASRYLNLVGELASYLILNCSNVSIDVLSRKDINGLIQLVLLSLRAILRRAIREIYNLIVVTLDVVQIRRPQRNTKTFGSLNTLINCIGCSFCI